MQPHVACSEAVNAGFPTRASELSAPALQLSGFHRGSGPAVMLKSGLCKPSAYP